MTEPHGPLRGVKVVACSTAQAGTVPYMLMADLGAEVIKIEVPEIGDNSRGSTVMPGFPSTYFETNNRGVKSLTLNLKEAEGRDILYKLVAQAEEKLREEGCRTVLLETGVDNDSAIRFYKKHGYSVLRTLPRYYLDRLDAFLMGKKL